MAYEGIDDINNAGDGVFSLVAKDANGNDIDISKYKITIKGTDDASTYYSVGKNNINVIKETGEIILGENAYNALKQAADVQVTYAKKQFEPGDLRPEHYFDCKQYTVQSDGRVKTIEYTKPESGQPIYYEVNFNQSIQVNTEGNKIISAETTNNVNDLIYSLKAMEDAEKVQARLKELLTDTQYVGNKDAVSQINKMIQDMDVEIAVRKENLQKTFSKNISVFQEYSSNISQMQSDVGSRMSKLEMIDTRVKEQFASFKELKSQNEDVETDEAIIDFNEAGLVYMSALAATSKIMDKTLLDYL